MIDVLYSWISITPGSRASVDDCIKMAARIGYRLTAFEGLTDSDLGARFGEMKGARRDFANANGAHIKAINEQFEDDFAILQTAPQPNSDLYAWHRAK